jgi:hypothetical protein
MRRFVLLQDEVQLTYLGVRDTDHIYVFSIVLLGEIGLHYLLLICKHFLSVLHQAEYCAQFTFCANEFCKDFKSTNLNEVHEL